MDFKVVGIFNRSVTFEMDNNEAYSTGEQYEVYIDGVYKDTVEKNVFSVYGLRPDTEYLAELKLHGDSSADATSRCLFKTKKETALLNVSDFGAAGDGKKNDTSAMQAAIACCPVGGTVHINKGTYLTGPLFLKSQMTLWLDEGAVLLGITDRNEYPILPGMVRRTDETKKEVNFTSWEGNPLDSFASLITGQDVTDVDIIGQGIIDGNAQNSDWWIDVRRRRGAWRPKIIEFTKCKNMCVQGIKLQNSPSWTIHPYYSDNITLLDCNIYNPDESPNTDGIDPESCSDVKIIGTTISVGDDCIALKSGKIYMSKYHYKKMENVIIRNCKMERGHGAVTIGSEIACGVFGLEVRKCVFSKTDRGLRIKSRRGRGDKSVLEDLSFENIKMQDVHMPFTVNMFYFCDPDGHSDYVQSQEAFPVDDKTPKVGNITIKDVECTGVDAVFACIYGLPESPVDGVYLDNVKVSYLPEEERTPMCPIMMDNFDDMSGRSLFIKNANMIEMSNVVIEGSVDNEPELINVNQRKMGGIEYRNGKV